MRKRLIAVADRSRLLQAFGQRLRALRLERGLSPTHFEATSGIDAGNLDKYERGDREPGLVVIMMMARGLNVDHRELLRFDFSIEYGFSPKQRPQ